LTDFRTFTAEDAVAVASDALSRAWGGPVRVDAVQNLGDEARRNLIMRARALPVSCPIGSAQLAASQWDQQATENKALDGAVPRFVIIKATRAASYDPAAANAYQTSGFVKEWAAARTVARHATMPALTPRLLADDVGHGVLVYDDLGEGLPSLVGPLLHGTADAAEQAVIAYAEALAALHRATIGCRDSHAAILQAGFPAASVPPPAHRWIEDVASKPHALLGGDFPDDEAELILAHLKQPGCWQALVHGDPCPDNVLLAADGRAALIDLEFARPGHALLDSAYWRMGFPTCWCAGTVPDGVARRADLAYRAAVAAAVPQAADDAAFSRESAIIDAAWMLGNLAWLLPGALAADGKWGLATNRSRIVTYLQRAIRSTGEADVLPRLRALAAAWLEDLRGRWPDTAPLRAFPAFAAPPPA
jgi:aminoglycoside/choline kinase family phosphotransferase